MDTYEQIAEQLEAGSLAPEPAILTGARIGYARVSTAEQLPSRCRPASRHDPCEPGAAGAGGSRQRDL